MRISDLSRATAHPRRKIQNRRRPAGRKDTRPKIPRLCYSIDDFCKATSLGRTLVKELIKSGELPHFKLGRRVLIPLKAAIEFLASCPPARDE
ncbi:MAG: helix-turn-helix domain-containing protein [Alphaproteobacteria bacterium]|nr:helix-turn-helix domain-containing protein [Alphaproteobacteria bacterium]MBU0799082.1 helix-turn-helix domain-containing protein [Alphaproteobacteria bacterium]MBU0885586.1 helix-turn-helix domain-containing protein [Alphaproteobacteria bacterium]MBU1813759.1 helix-turn-helix domain-containing protein [Alphaproteobacteria bacterium]MBU2091428.1 helix-turn-helix domain-containing protein [Alphaproteobacteria bacterium]